MSAAEYWVLAVVVPRGGMVGDDLGHAIARGDLLMVNGEVVEPVEVYDTESDAREGAIRHTAKTGREAKVTLSVDPEDL